MLCAKHSRILLRQARISALVLVLFDGGMGSPLVCVADDGLQDLISAENL